MICPKPKSHPSFLCKKHISCLSQCPQDTSLVSQCGVFLICPYILCHLVPTVQPSMFPNIPALSPICPFAFIPSACSTLLPSYIPIPFLLANAPRSWLGHLFLGGLPPHPQVTSVDSMLCPTLLIPVLHLLVYLRSKQEFYSSLLRWKKCHIPLFLKLKPNVLLILIPLNHRNSVCELPPSPTLPRDHPRILKFMQYQKTGSVSTWFGGGMLTCWVLIVW